MYSGIQIFVELILQKLCSLLIQHTTLSFSIFDLSQFAKHFQYLIPHLGAFLIHKRTRAVSKLVFFFLIALLHFFLLDRKIFPSRKVQNSRRSELKNWHQIPRTYVHFISLSTLQKLTYI